MRTPEVSRHNFFLRPIPLGAVLIMAVNDHYLKYQYPGWITGKLSDFMGVFYLPIFLLATFVLVPAWIGRTPLRLGRATIWGAILITDCLLIGVKLHPGLNAWITDAFRAWLFPIRIAADPTDLWALVMNPLSNRYLSRYRA